MMSRASNVRMQETTFADASQADALIVRRGMPYWPSPATQPTRIPVVHSPLIEAVYDGTRQTGGKDGYH